MRLKGSASVRRAIVGWLVVGKSGSDVKGFLVPPLIWYNFRGGSPDGQCTSIHPFSSGSSDSRSGGLGGTGRSKTANGVREGFLGSESRTGCFTGFLYSRCHAGAAPVLLQGPANESNRRPQSRRQG